MGGYDLGMLEANEVAAQIEEAASDDALIIFGAAIDEKLKDEIVVTVIATGFEDQNRDNTIDSIFGQVPQSEEKAENVENSQEAVQTQTQESEGSDAYSSSNSGINDFPIPEFLREKKGF